VIFLRLIARFPDKEQIGSLVDSLRNVGFDRKDMIISDLTEKQELDNIRDAAREVPLVKTETDSLSSIAPIGDGIMELRGKEGIMVSIELPKHSTNRVREIMEQSGAVEIIQD
jgi:hypothetical protein